MDPAPANGQVLDAGDDTVHVEQAAKALDVSRRTVERMIERGELQRDTRHDNAAAVTKRSLVTALQERRGATRRRVAPSHEMAGLLASLERLTDTLADERRQLVAAGEDRRRAERDREEARIEVAQLEAARQAAADRLTAEQQARAQSEVARQAATERLAQLASAGWRERRRILHELRRQAI